MIALLDYGMGNLKSVENALECIGAKVKVTANPEDIMKADGIVIPGVGAFADGMRNLQQLGIVEILKDEIMQNKKPYLGICLGMQFLAEIGFESGETKGLCLIPGNVKRLHQPENNMFKIPHMGWNDVKILNQCPIFERLGENPVFYFVHSYYFAAEPEFISAICYHGQEVTAAVWKENIFGVQFHPEKSQGAGLKVLENFCKLVSG